MDSTSECPPRYAMTPDGCSHFLFPPDIWQIIGTLILCCSNGLATIAGIGGGSISLVFLMFFFQYMPKDATLVVFCAIFGTSLGNTTNLITKAHNGKPLIQYHLLFVSVPIVFTGAFIGVLLNKMLPSIVVCLIIVLVFGSSIKKTYVRFKNQYDKQTSENLINLQQNKQIIEQSKFNPWEHQIIRQILKNIGFIFVVLLILSMMRGSEKFPSIIGIAPCSGLFWGLQFFSFVLVGLYGWRNIQILKGWYQNCPQKLGEALDEQNGDNTSKIQQNIGELIQKSVFAGIISGFGLGGGIFLVAMYRHLGCRPLQATASSAMSIFITSLLNCFQGITIGAIQVTQFAYYMVFLGIGGYLVSKLIASQLRKRNRLSYVEGVLVCLTIFSVINIPLSLYRKYALSGYDSSVLFGFGSIC